MIGIISILFYILFGYCLRKFGDVEKSYIVPLFEVTAGDKRRRDKYFISSKKAERRIDFWVGTIAASFFTGVLSSLAVVYFA